MWGQERQPRAGMVVGSDRPSLLQLRAATRSQTRGGSAAQTAGQRRRMEEQPSGGDDQASKRPREVESQPFPSPPRTDDTPLPPLARTTLAASTVVQSAQTSDQGQIRSRRPATAHRETGVSSEVVPPPPAWALTFVVRGGAMLTEADSVRQDPSVVNVLLKGLALSWICHPWMLRLLTTTSWSCTAAWSRHESSFHPRLSLSFKSFVFSVLTLFSQASQASTTVHKKAVAMAKATRSAQAKLKEEHKAAEQLKAEEGLGKKLQELSLESQGVKDRTKAAEDRATAAVRDAMTTEEKAKEAMNRAKAAEDKLRDLQFEQADMLAAANVNGFRRGE